MPVSREILGEIALNSEEYSSIVAQLGREPTGVELGLFAALWSEHCAYKYSRALLKHFPSGGRHVLVPPGRENAGVVDIGNGLVAVLKIESRNHASALEPYQGAATGVGGIVRDIFTMGARPVALMNSLRFGPLKDSRNRYLFDNVISGIADYGNCLGIPEVGGEVYFDECYSGSPLVNTLCLGITKAKSLVKSRAHGEDNILMLVGADTGRDGLRGVSGQESATFDEHRELSSAVRIGNPFIEKLLIEACLELAGTDWIVGMQDLGAAGLSGSVIESASKGESGIELDVLKVTRREKGMTPYEVMLSESQERMLVVVKRDCADKVKAVLERWGLHSDSIGRVTGDGLARIKEGDKIVAEAPVAVLSSPPEYRLRAKRPEWLDEVQSFEIRSLPDISIRKISTTLIQLLASPNIASKHSIYRQYDHQVMNNTVVAPGSDAAVLRIKGTGKALSLTVDGNGRYCYLNPFVGGVIAVAEAARNLACSGASPLAVTDCLNFGNPEKNDVYYQLKECITGITRACREFRVPVVSGNVSLYNEAGDKAIYPTPVVGMLGIIDDIDRHCSAGFKNEGDVVVLVGTGETTDNSLSGSEYLKLLHDTVRGAVSIDLEFEKRVQRCCIDAIRKGVINSAHDCSEGGLLVCLAESCLIGGLGFESTTWRTEGRLDTALFGEAQSRIVVSLDPGMMARLEKIAGKWRVPLTRLGVVKGSRLHLKGYITISLEKMQQAWFGGFGL